MNYEGNQNGTGIRRALPITYLVYSRPGPDAIMDSTQSLEKPQCVQHENEINMNVFIGPRIKNTGGGGEGKKRVRFHPEVTVHHLLHWAFAYQIARQSPWEEAARDRERFWKRINHVGETIGKVFQKDHREKIQQLIQGNQEI
ncbi:hypothetical protein QAD02_022064 [Eretmocerus hayati]|uniref:Uncharacterized protein n=4 Tax=Eretmocerus hayati TaxID=131215 RepID=A0ACC2PS83_9HYME|nr:hypothetical protein QAD02_010299 [Eretmocerus hayati]KAJ8672754.1 hypothetical protein QAD02_004014 [Eretmocerus hayati]KAJ8680966.1 hypothetical protein QAD02_016753 [Eretmocerus hayati]KAJ8686270.1 hypothetical protein QAD02_022064 [Eretmocerus hayati]